MTTRKRVTCSKCGGLGSRLVWQKGRWEDVMCKGCSGAGWVYCR